MGPIKTLSNKKDKKTSSPSGDKRRADVQKGRAMKSKKANKEAEEEQEMEEEDRWGEAEEEEGQGQDHNEEDGEENDKFDSDEELHFHGFSTDDDDSSDEDDETEPPPIDAAKLPTIAKDDAAVKRKLEKAKRQPVEEPGVLFLGRVPHGFYEDQMRAYFSQFGNVTRLRLSRNKKTGRSKHYAFIEFDSAPVAKIVADTMDNYLLMGHILKCKVIPKDKVHPEIWVGANRKWRAVPQARVTRTKHNKPRTEEEQKRVSRRLIRRQNQRKRKLAEAGIIYDLDPVSYKKPK